MESSIHTVWTFWSLNCTNGLWIIHYILKVSRYTNAVYIGVYLVMSYIEIFTLTVCYFLSCFCKSVNCIVTKFHRFFTRYSETETKFIFDGFQYCHLWKVHFQLSSTFSAFLVTFCWLVSCMKWIFDFVDFQKLIKH